MKYRLFLLAISIALPAVAAPTKAIKTSLGQYHGCALIEGIGETEGKRRLQCWGNNDKGQYSTASEIEHLQFYPSKEQPKLPVVDFGGEILDFAASAYSTCVILRDESIRCVGENFTTEEFSRGAAMGPEIRFRLKEPFSFRLPNDVPVSIVSGEGAGFYDQYCISTKSDRVHCFRPSDIVPWKRRKFAQDWPDSFFGQKDLNPHTVIFPMGRTVTQVSMNGNTVCALLDNQKIKCIERLNEFGAWGAPNLPTLEKISALWREKKLHYPGFADDVSYADPAYELPFESKAISVSAGKFMNCAAFEDGTAKCWGLSDRAHFPMPFFQPWYAYPSGSNRVHQYPPEPDKGMLYIAAPENRKITKVFTDGLSRVCFQMTPGSEDLSSNVKCASDIENLSETTKASPNWIDSIAWLPSGLPVRSISLGGEQVATRSCAIFQNNGVKCWGSESKGSLGYATDFRSYSNRRMEDAPFLEF